MQPVCGSYVNRYENAVDSDPDAFCPRRIQGRIRLLVYIKKISTVQYSSDNFILKNCNSRRWLRAHTYGTLLDTNTMSLTEVQYWKGA